MKAVLMELYLVAMWDSAKAVTLELMMAAYLVDCWAAESGYRMAKAMVEEMVEK